MPSFHCARARLLWIILVAGAASPAAVSAAVFTSAATVSYTLVGSTTKVNFTEGVTKDYGGAKSLTTTNPYASPARLDATIGGTHPGGNSSASVSATANVEAGAGLMRLRLNGSTGITRAPNSDTADARLTRLSAKVAWNDGYIVTGNPAHPQPGRPLVIRAFLNLDGDLSSSIVPGGFSSVQLDLYLRARDALNRNLLATPAPYFDAFAREHRSTLTPDYLPRPAPSIIPVQLTTFEGAVAEMHFEMELTGSAASFHNDFVPASGVATSTTFDGDYSHTLTWGGITSITDANTGQSLTGWSIASASGVNYANPVPEPRGAVILSLAALTLLRRFRTAPR